MPFEADGLGLCSAAISLCEAATQQVTSGWFTLKLLQNLTLFLNRRGDSQGGGVAARGYTTRALLPGASVGSWPSGQRTRCQRAAPQEGEGPPQDRLLTWETESPPDAIIVGSNSQTLSTHNLANIKKYHRLLVNICFIKSVNYRNTL